MNLLSKWTRSALAGTFFVVFAAAGYGQDATSGSISGTVTDASGALIKGASITIINTDRNHVERTTTTNAGGFFTATALPLGTYTVKIEDSGFKSQTITGLELHVNDALTVN